jgi:hypothetical protein
LSSAIPRGSWASPITKSNKKSTVTLSLCYLSSSQLYGQ